MKLKDPAHPALRLHDQNGGLFFPGMGGKEQSVDQQAGDHLVESISPERVKTGRQLKVFAWAIEVLAVTIGLGIAVMQLYASFSELNASKETELNFGDWSNIMIAALPFIMVAFVEITKIPFVDAFYKTSSRLWKTVFLLSLMIISLITFESALNGFERNFNALNISVSRLQKQTLVVDESMEPLEQRIERAQSITLQDIEDQFTGSTQNLTQQKLSQIESIEERKRLLQARVQDEFTSNLQAQITRIRERVGILQSQMDAELSRISASYDDQRRSRLESQSNRVRQLVADLGREQNALEESRRAARTAIEAANIFMRGSVREEQEEAIKAQQSRVEAARSRLERAQSGEGQAVQAEAFRREQTAIREGYEQRIRAEESEIDELQSQLSQALGTRTKDLESQLSELDEEIGKINLRFEPQFSELSDIRAQQLSTLENNESLISQWTKELDALRDRRVVLRDQTNTAIGNNQVYRMAQLFSGVESAADIPPEYVVKIATIWFGSLAAMVAFTGVILALASNVLLDPTKPDYDRARPGLVWTGVQKSVRSLRRFLIHRRRLDRQPIIREKVVELTKEVPVEKVVTVEVPVEIIRKELVHVPLYTNDPKLLDLVANPETEANS